jgi:UPF0755 protein
MRRKLFLIAFVVTLGYLVGHEFWWKAPATDAQDIVVIIASGLGVGDIAGELKKAGIIESPFLFKSYVKLSGKSAKLQAGEFTLRPGMSISDTLRVIQNARANEVTLTFLEGWTIKDMGAYLEAEGVVTASVWALAARPDLEGYLFPDTYRFLKGVAAPEIVEKMRDTFEKKAVSGLLDRTESVFGSSLTAHEVLTLASIVEAEVRSFEDRKKVADIFLRRLEIGMALQADSTVNYVTGKKTPSISFDDRDLDSPYNTYKYRGLPPGPIGNPGAEAIRAVLEHASNPFFFFLTDEDGNVYYARTLDEHNINKARYLK